MATYDNPLRIKEITPGDEDGIWGASTNTTLELIGMGFGAATQALAGDANETFTITDNAVSALRALSLTITGTTTASRTITLAPATVNKLWFIKNATTGTSDIIIKQGSGATVTIAQGTTKIVATDGAGASGAVTEVFSSVIDPAQIAGLQTSLTELNYLVGTTTNVQTQINTTVDAITAAVAALEASRVSNTTFDVEHEADDGTHKYVSLPVRASAPTTPVAGGSLYVKVAPSIPGLFFKDSAGNEVQIISGGAINYVGPVTYTPTNVTTTSNTYSGWYTGKISNLTIVAGVLTMSWTALYINYTNTESHYIEWEDMPLVDSGIGQTICLTITNAGDYPIILSAQTGYTVQRKNSEDLGTLTTGGVDELIAQVSVPGIVSVTVNRDFVNNV